MKDLNKLVREKGPIKLKFLMLFSGSQWYLAESIKDLVENKDEIRPSKPNLYERFFRDKAYIYVPVCYFNSIGQGPCFGELSDINSDYTLTAFTHRPIKTTGSTKLFASLIQYDFGYWSENMTKPFWLINFSTGGPPRRKRGKIALLQNLEGLATQR